METRLMATKESVNFSSSPGTPRFRLNTHRNRFIDIQPVKDHSSFSRMQLVLPITRLYMHPVTVQAPDMNLFGRELRFNAVAGFSPSTYPTHSGYIACSTHLVEKIIIQMHRHSRVYGGKHPFRAISRTSTYILYSSDKAPMKVGYRILQNWSYDWFFVRHFRFR